MPTPDSVKTLIETFERNLDFYKSDRYNEAQLRQEFLDPFFKAMGWDMDNTSGVAPQYRDVIHEASIRIGGFTKAPDYAFSIHGQWKFFLEAKKPAVNVKDNADPAYQLRRYGWSAKLPVSILTDFEELSVYDCRKRPQKGENASASRLEYIKYQDFVEKWDEIYGTFSKEAILNGSFDKYTLDSKRHRGAETVDDAFLGEIEHWRDLLARNLALRNLDLSVRDLNFSVQKIIDRLIFLRICEDRGTEDYKRLAALLNGTRCWPRLQELFIQADARYNSGLFHFSSEKDRGAPDTITPSLSLDDKVLKEIIAKLYYPESPYEFSVLPADILGQVYEQFLGKTIHLTAGHQARIEEKPEVRKAGGVYYTPGYIVDYIVKNTLGRLLDGDDPAKPKPVSVSKAAEIKVLDPACGSGSFLIVAYQHLLDWHLRQYTADEIGAPDEGKIKRHAQGKNPKIYKANDGSWRLSTAERKRILLNSIHGVDIDSQAVEVTKLSLLLKVVEGNTFEILHSPQLSYEGFRLADRILPDLEKNIKCGNSLIGPDFYENEQMLLLDEETQYRINVFDWKRGFPEIMNRGGFDCVIGNPPYIRIQTMKEWAPVEVELYKKIYKSANAGNYDIYVVFVEKALSLLNKAGRMGYILPHKFFNAKYGEPLRGVIAAGNHLAHVVHFGSQQIFSGATTYTCLLFLDGGGANDCRLVKVDDVNAWRIDGRGNEGLIPAKAVTKTEWNFTVGAGSELVERLKTMPCKLGDVADIFVGLQTSADDVFILDYIDETDKTIRLKSKSLKREVVLEQELLHPLVSGQDVSGYPPLPYRQFIIFPYEIKDEKASLIPFDQIEQRWPKTAAYLLENRKCLEDREKGKMKGSRWHGYIYLKNMTRQSLCKLCVPRLVDELCAGYDHDGSHFLDNVDVGGVTIKPEYEQHSLVYLLALLNSRLIRWFFPNVSAPFRGGWYSANRQFLTQVPVRIIDFTKPQDKLTHDKMVVLVERMLELNRKKSVEKNPDALRQLETQIAATDSQIDRLVYDLYNLTESEIAIVEGQK